MRRDDAIRLLKQAEPELRARGVVSLALFGSTARDEAGPESDVDVLIELDMARRPSLVDFSGVRLFLGDTLGREADLAIKGSLRPTYRANIEADSIPIF